MRSCRVFRRTSLRPLLISEYPIALQKRFFFCKDCFRCCTCGSVAVCCTCSFQFPAVRSYFFGSLCTKHLFSFG